MAIIKNIYGDKIIEGEGDIKSVVEYAVENNISLALANLEGENLEGAYLIGANLEGANLALANLEGANLIGANLKSTNLKGANLERANLQYANLKGVNIDFSCWPLWCGGRNVKVDARIFRQLIDHILVLECDGAEAKKAQKWLRENVKRSHRARELGLI